MFFFIWSVFGRAQRSRDGLMESCLCCGGGGPPTPHLLGWPTLARHYIVAWQYHVITWWMVGGAWPLRWPSVLVARLLPRKIFFQLCMNSHKFANGFWVKKEKKRRSMCLDTIPRLGMLSHGPAPWKRETCYNPLCRLSLSTRIAKKNHALFSSKGSEKTLLWGFSLDSGPPCRAKLSVSCVWSFHCLVGCGI